MRAQPRYFAVTDADLVMGDALPPNWLQALAFVAQHLKAKAGAALDVSRPADMWRGEWTAGHSVAGWEGRFWHGAWPALPAPLQAALNASAYRAFIDTTLAAYRRDDWMAPATPPALPSCGGACVSKYGDGARLAGAFTAWHLPWFARCFVAALLPGELEAQYGRKDNAGVGSTIAGLLRREGQLAADAYSPHAWANFSRPAWAYVAGFRGA